MRKWFFVTGVVILLVGIVTAASCNSSVMSSKKDDYLYESQNSWELSGNFSRGEGIRVICYPGGNWSRWSEDIDNTITVPHKHIWFEIVDPKGDIAEFNTGWTQYGPNGQVPFARAWVNVTVRSDGLWVPAQYPQYVGGIALLNGTYTVRVVREFFGDSASGDLENPPAYLYFSREQFVPQYPYTNLLPVGISIALAGTAITVASAEPLKNGDKKRRTRHT